MIVEIRVHDTPKNRWVGWVEGAFSLNIPDESDWEAAERQAVYQFRHEWRSLYKDIRGKTMDPPTDG